MRDRMILPILDQRGFDVVLLMHSSSSVPGSAAAKGLSKPERLSQGKSTGVIGQIFVAAMLGREGQTIMDLLGGKLPPHIVLDVSVISYLPRIRTSAHAGAHMKMLFPIYLS